MKVAVTWTIPADLSKTAIARFLDTGAPPPAGVTMIGRWHGLDGAHGFIIAESADPKAIFAWIAEWTELVNFTVTPVLDDSEAVGVWQSIRK
jgi:hypothetical protein